MATVCEVMREGGVWSVGETDIDDLCKVVCEVALWGGCEEGEVDENVLWLPERADEILSGGSIDGRLSANG
jgi:hypothetical protein